MKKLLQNTRVLTAFVLVLSFSSAVIGKTITAQCKNDRNQDQGIIQAAIDSAVAGDVVLIKGKLSGGLSVCQLDGNGTGTVPATDTRLKIKTSGITVTGPQCDFGDAKCWTTIKGDLGTNGLPISDNVNANRNRAISILISGVSGVNTDKVIIKNLRFQDLHRSIQAQALANFVTNVCPCKTIMSSAVGGNGQLLAKNANCTDANLRDPNFDVTGNGCFLSSGDPNYKTVCAGNLDLTNFPPPTGKITNPKVMHNWVVNSRRGPQGFGAVEGMVVSDNKIEDFGETGVLMVGGTAGCFNLTEGDPNGAGVNSLGAVTTGDVVNVLIQNNKTLRARADFPEAGILVENIVSGKILRNEVDGRPSSKDTSNPAYSWVGIGGSNGFPTPATFLSDVLIRGNKVSNAAGALIQIGYDSVNDPFGEGSPTSGNTTNGYKVKCNQYANPNKQSNWLFGIVFPPADGKDVYLGPGSFNNVVKESHGVSVLNQGTNNTVNTNFDCQNHGDDDS